MGLEPVNEEPITIEDQKYLVYKAGEMTPLEPGTYFVIRSSDVFGPAALYGYAHLIQTTLEVTRTTDDSLPVEVREWLGSLADHVVDLAQEWQRAGDMRVPD